MAIDTQDKRRSVLNHTGPGVMVLPVPDASIDTADRPHVTWSYRGLTYSEIVVVTISSDGETAAYIDFRDKRAIISFRDKRGVA